MPDLPIWLWGPLVAVVYGAACWVIGNRFPFSIYDFYGSSAIREEGAVRVFLVGGEEADLAGYDRFVGLEPDAMYPPGFPCSMEWVVNEAKRYVREHPGDEAGPVAVQWGFRVLKVDAAGAITERLEVVAEGTAWPKPR